MTPQSFLSELEKALDEYRYDDVGDLVNEVDPSAFDEKQVKATLGQIRRKRLFPELERVAALFTLAGQTAPVVKRQWAQALIDQGRIEQGLVALRTVEAGVKNDPAEGPEVRGLIGRALKQRFVKEGKPEDLKRAVLQYQLDWNGPEYKHRWHGINYVALLARAARDGIDAGVSESATEHAQRILDDIESLQETPAWDLATALEASVALNDKKRALAWAKAYVGHDGTDAFELGATIRQLVEIWKIDGTPLGATLLPVLEYEMLQRKDGTVELSGVAGDNDGFQAVYGGDGHTNFEWFDTMYARSRAVGRVKNSATGAACGTGFVLRGGDLKNEWGDDPVFVTNSHVLSERPTDEAPLKPGEGTAEFTRIEGRPRVELGHLLFSSPRNELDVSVCKIEPPTDLKPVKITTYRPVDQQNAKAQRIYVVGHPNGAEMTVSLYSNDLAGYEDPYVRYKSPTDTGHSGSPVFNRTWQAFAVHHRALGDLQVNEGVLMEFISGKLQ